MTETLPSLEGSLQVQLTLRARPPILPPPRDGLLRWCVDWSAVDVEHTLLTSAGALLRDYAGATSRVEAGRPPAAALQVLKDHVSVDVPRHPGPPPASFARTPPTDDLARSMRARHLATVCLADVPDCCATRESAEIRTGCPQLSDPERGGLRLASATRRR